MVWSTKEKWTLQSKWSKGMEQKSLQMEGCIKDTGKKTRKMGLEEWFTPVETSTKDTGWMESGMVKENSGFKMVTFMMDLGKMG